MCGYCQFLLDAGKQTVQSQASSSQPEVPIATGTCSSLWILRSSYYFTGMSAQGTSGKRNSSEPEHPLRLLSAEYAHAMKFRDRQSFFEDVLQPDADCFTRAYWQIKSQRPPLSSVSSMEVNVDTLEQVDLLDVPDHEVLGDFLNFNMDGFEVSALSDEQFYNNQITLQDRNSAETRSRKSSTSSNSTDPNSADGAETPTVQSDEEDVQDDTSLPTTSTDQDIVTQPRNES
ncbi:dysbindin domain-containing protein 2-like [Hypanus sabinus]|uniref:dysbindin domain-containing protein 2-like n=1 Tax=Hypanus sabinus TaxID=79690 RepID=UPI0028C40FAB|nr:dysbindin domain-containing protein 2-like [Hypanus sabinus]